MSLPPQFKRKATAVGEAAISEVAPIIFRGVVLGWLEKKSAAEFYEFLERHKGQNWLDDLVPPRVRGRIQAFSKGGMGWLTLEWFVETVCEHPDIVSLIASSEEVRAELETQISNIRDGLK